MARTAVMTGATGAMGAVAVKELSKAGINVVMVTHNQEAADALSKECEAYPGEVVAMANSQGDDAVFDDVYARFGSVDIVIPNHGAPDWIDDVADVDPEELTKKFNHQVVNTYKMIKRALPYLKEGKQSRIILMTNVSAYMGDTSKSFVSTVANGAMTSMMRYMAADLAKDGITVNCIAKGDMEPDHPLKPQDIAPSGINTPIGRNATADDFANAIMFLAKEESSYITGQTIFLAGGKVRY